MGMRPAPQMHVEWVDDEAVVLDSESGQVHYLNSSAAFVYASILEHGFDEAVARLERSQGTSPGFPEQLSTFLDEMKEKGLILDD
jgi:PqqD family protein of HPr-rel-A system